ncbi:hypothetical protein AKO1_006257 [Acrasis kona]|uniref:AB hydrolase-1 domain-containing protein n=1 Tax=Acrasis kona TaxID=1008807 RepID=A0AAW2YH78_9EUKA
MGGNMNNNVTGAFFHHFVEDMEDHPLVIQESVACVVRFNTRGVGQSTGSSTVTAWEERDDIISVCNYVLERCNIQKIIFIGYSCGSLLTSGVADLIPQVHSFVAISYPKGWWASWLFSNHYKEVLPSKKPKLFILGTSDQFASTDSFSVWFDDVLKEPKKLQIYDGDHFWFGMEVKLLETVKKWMVNQILSTI